MSLNSRINKIQNQVSALRAEHDDTVPVMTGVVTIDGKGNMSGGTITRVPKDQADAFGVMLVPEQQTEEDWRKRSAEFHKHQATDQAKLKAEAENQI
jgi:hypothetical protein